MSRKFVSDPREVVRPGDVVRVKVLGVDTARKRISLTLRLDDEPGRDREERGQSSRPASRPSAGSGRGGGKDSTPDGGAMAEALRRAGLVR